MIDYGVRALSGFLILMFLLFVAPLTNIEWLQPGHPYRFIIVPIALIGGWGCLFLYKKVKKQKTENV
ncbi:hypothetical protein RYX56_00915 [Alkalihalophilus lindianensis]|uniref:Uncharacterized protein n=1 Tax=Alkalihalophilus lindianensis TaxID=1630542 RepID=A0ABU3X4X0_9BACI|nr:hypothetical protein [Alkalihalophilus lindianensis]MDV2682926.1 hypothetical protein [Alkalihalophilus lindianensis]